ncbi:MAG: carboxy-S-adenosyl-L-methionine synthase CmoA [Proteobacteria bacterium]|nr:carboxy-S-adenosyl-L-methionine synthase CmoA [Pseudomonadota bacterium]MBU1737994.1 carboxy-S-adenosyl-L-methionine synthase CmoA [Pseudomonadota bacterium]
MKDDIYQHNGVDRDFRFDDKVADVFDDMLTRSVPCYQTVITMITSLLNRELAPGDTVYDLGSSTGNTLAELARNCVVPDLRFIGIDSSEAMISKALHKAEMFSLENRLTFRKGDIIDLEIADGGAIILNYTLQFIRPVLRDRFVKKLYASLRPGGILILSEKIISASPELNRAYIDFYLDFKRRNGYSETEIARKREALENVLIPFSIEENRELLSRAGFKTVETFFQWFNFSSMIAIKSS